MTSHTVYAGSLHYVYQSSERALFQGSETSGEEKVTYLAYKVYQEAPLSPREITDYT